MACNVLFSFYTTSQRTLSARDTRGFVFTHTCLPADPASGIPAKDKPPDR